MYIIYKKAELNVSSIGWVEPERKIIFLHLFQLQWSLNEENAVYGYCRKYKFQLGHNMNSDDHFILLCVGKL